MTYFPLFCLQLPINMLVKMGMDSQKWTLNLNQFYDHSLAKIHGKLAFIEQEKCLTLFESLLQNWDIQVLASWYLNEVRSQHLGAIGMAIITGSTLADCLKAAIKYLPLVLPQISWNYIEDKNKINLHPKISLDFPYFSIASELVVDILIKFLNTSFQGNIRPNIFSKIYSVDNTPGIAISNINLLQPNPDAAPILHLQMCDECNQGILELNHINSLSLKIRKLMIIAISKGDCYTLIGIAQAFNLTARTLTRRLREEGTSFRELQIDVRMEIAKQKLSQTKQSIKSIGLQLGFNDISSFSRAFRHYYSQSPTAYRQISGQ